MYSEYFRALLAGALFLAPIGCITAEHSISQIGYQLTSRDVQALASAYPHNDISVDCEKELMVGASFAQENDLYRAITAFKRALFLSKAQAKFDAYMQAEYALTLAYYLGAKYDKSISCFENSSLESLTPESPYYKSLLLILFDSYVHTKNYMKAANALALTTRLSAPLGKTLEQYQSIATAELLHKDPQTMQDAEQAVYSIYDKFKKSPFRAGLFNALLPGAGYMYVGQVQSGITSLLLNTLFIAATAKFFQDGQTAAGIITAGFECGWYFGGIRGANLAAQQYNELLYSRLAKEVMYEKKIFPILLIDVGF